jgi:hypothetical protein
MSDTEQITSDQEQEEDIDDTEEVSSSVEEKGERESFKTKLSKFMQERGTPIGKLPQLGGRTLDLFKLYKEVIARGGTEIVCIC